MKTVSKEITYYNSKIERMSREELEALQFKKLQYQLRFVYENVPMYRRLCQDYKLHPDDIKTREDFFQKWPTISKADLIKDQTENPPWGTRVGIPVEKIVQVHLTSGTSGLGQEIYANSYLDVEYLGSN